MIRGLNLLTSQDATPGCTAVPSPARSHAEPAPTRAKRRMPAGVPAEGSALEGLESGTGELGFDSLGASCSWVGPLLHVPVQ